MRTRQQLFLNGALWTSVLMSLSGQPTGTGADAAALPLVIVSAASDTAEATVRLSVVEKPVATDIAAGMLENELAKERRIVPELTVIAVTAQGKDWDVTIKVNRLIPFGESKVPLLYKGEKKATLRFYKVGLVLADPAEGGFIARQGSPLTLVLKNQTGDNYDDVRLRMRFLDLDVCEAETDRFGPEAKDKTQVQTVGESLTSRHRLAGWLRPNVAKSRPDCRDASQWTRFKVAKYASVTLRIEPPDEWFRDPKTGFHRRAKQQGVLSVQFIGTGTPPVVHELNLPLEVQFEPDDSSLFWGVARIVAFLLLGALLALCLRVVIPNYRRKKALREQLQVVAKATRGISEEVPSVLRVLLRVERLTLDKIRKSSWVAGPNYPEAAERVDKGLITLQRKIELTRRLDTALSRMSILEQDDVPPTRLAAIEKHLSMACESLKRDQLLEQDWVFIQQKLEAADQLLGEPSQEEKDAFDASLVQRWKAINEFFSFSAPAPALPINLEGMKKCLPSEQGLPKTGDDGSKWVKTIGAVRADLQLRSLEMLRDFVLLAPAGNLVGDWKTAEGRLTILLATPAIENLKAARLLLEGLAEGVDVKTLTKALSAKETTIEWDPQSVEPNEKVRMRVRFRDGKLQTAAARRSIKCEWVFCDQRSPRRTWWGSKKALVTPTPYREQGWEIYHYFESDILRSDFTVRFYADGKLVTGKGPEPLVKSEDGKVVTGEGPDPLVKSEDGKVVTGEGTEPLVIHESVQPQERERTRNEWWERFRQAFPEALQILAALLVPIAALAVAQARDGATGSWWELAGIGFGNETIRNILTGTPPAASPPANPPK